MHAPQHTEVLSGADFRAEAEMEDSRVLLCVIEMFSVHFECTKLHEDSNAPLLITCRELDSADGSFPACLQFEACEADGEKCQLLLQSTTCITFIKSANSHWRFIGQVRLGGLLL